MKYHAVVISILLVLSSSSWGSELPADDRDMKLSLWKVFPLESTTDEGLNGTADGSMRFKHGSLGVHLFMNGRIPSDSVEVGGFVPLDESFSRKRLEINPRDMYLFIPLNDFNVRIGFQTIQWGRFDEKSPLDLLNQEDIREFWVQDRADRKLHTPSIRLRWAMGNNWDCDAVLTPLATVPRLPLSGERWFPPIWIPPSAVAIEGAIVPVQSAYQNPSLPSWENQSSTGIRLRFVKELFDISLVGYHGYTPRVVLSRKIDYYADGVSSKILQTFSPVMKKETILGLGFSIVAGDALIFGETAYALKRHYTRGDMKTIEITSPPDFVEGEEIEGALGINYSLGEYSLSLQSGISRVLNPLITLNQPIRSTWYSLSAQRIYRSSWGNIDTAATIFWEGETNDGIFKSSVEIDLADNMGLKADFIAFPGYGIDNYLAQYRHHNEIKVSVVWYM